MPAEVFDLWKIELLQRTLYHRFTHLIGIVIGCRDFHCGRQVENNRMLLRAVFAREPGILHLVANIESEVLFSLGESLWRIFKLPFRAVSSRDALIDKLPDQLDVPHSKIYRLGLVVVEDDRSKAWRSCIVHVEDDARGSSNCLECPSNQILPRRRKNLDDGILSNGQG